MVPGRGDNFPFREEGVPIERAEAFSVSQGAGRGLHLHR